MATDQHKSNYKEILTTLTKRQEKSKNVDLKKAFQMLIETSGEKQTAYGITYIEHVIDIVKIAVDEIGLGRTSVTALILYHALKSAKLPLDNYKKEFNENIINITHGLIRISGIESSTKSSQADNYRRMLLVLAKDVRAILIRLAEQMALMRQMRQLSSEEQLKIAFESSFLYAPLAHRLGLYLIKSEMEDLSLKYTDRENYTMIAHRLDETMTRRNAFINDFIAPIQKDLKKQGFKFEIKGRPKSIHSIWNKMINKKVAFEDIYDLFAIRIIIKTDYKNEKADCWQVYSVVTDIFQPNPKRMRDWISVPKTNGYESLHTTVIGPDGRWVEVQIRTERMNDIAEKGVAAHWKYKGQSNELGIDDWLGNIRDILEKPYNNETQLIDDFKLNLYAKEVFIFTPKGDLRRFPEGATVLDFAFDIHTDVGSKCTGAKIGGKAVPIRHKLNNGDKVEILTSKTQKPTLDWLKFVVTSRAQKKIRQKLNEEKELEAQNGKEIITRRFKNWKIEYNDENIRKLLKHYKCSNAQDLYCSISTGKIDIAEVKDILTREEDGQNAESDQQIVEAIVAKPGQTKQSAVGIDFLVIDEQVANVDYKLAKCCNPILGDNVFGFVTINEGIKIHRTNCPNAVQLIGKYGYRVVKAKWNRSDADPVFPVEIKISGIDRPGLLAKVSEVISRDNSINLKNINVDAQDGNFEGILKLNVRDLNHLDWLMQNLMQINGIYYTGRIER